MAENNKSKIEESFKKMNTELSDQEMGDATGGMLDGIIPDPKFKVGDRFIDAYDPELDGVVLQVVEYMPIMGWKYFVRLHDKTTGETGEGNLFEREMAPA